MKDMNTTVVPPASSRNLPRFDDILDDVAPYPYTLEIFKSFPEKNRCTEFLDFIVDLREYSERYKSTYCKKEPPIAQSNEPQHLLSL